eukprot:COSAG02_NODE_161_length_32629_cov_10.363142_17_plen_238_part_00
MRDHLTSVELLACGAAAGAVGKTMLAPVDRVKLMYMTSKSHSFTLTEAAKTARGITQQSGVAGLWAGNGAAMLRVIPYSALVFTSFDVYQRGIQRVLNKKQGVFTRLSAGAAAGATATLMTYPLDLLRTRVRFPRMLAPLCVVVFRHVSDALLQVLVAPCFRDSLSIVPTLADGFALDGHVQVRRRSRRCGTFHNSHRGRGCTVGWTGADTSWHHPVRRAELLHVRNAKSGSTNTLS